MFNISMFSKNYIVRRMDDSDAAEILNLCKGNPMYYQYCNMEPSREQILSDLHITPPGVTASDKYYVGFYQNKELVAVMDLIDGYPKPDYGYIGFFMMHAAFQKQQIGSTIVRDVCVYLKQIGKTAVRLGIAEDNPQANHFWKKNGFRIVDKVKMDGWTALVAEKDLKREMHE